MLPKIKPYKTLIYLDYAATTPVDPRVVKFMLPYFFKIYGNPSALYKQGREADSALRLARGSIGKVLNCKPEEIIFTAGGTESVNLAILGVARNYPLQPLPLLKGKRERGQIPPLTKGRLGGVKPHIITSKIEHSAVLRSCEALEKQGCNVTYIDVDAQGFVKIDELKRAVRPETILISIMYANNEIGTVEPIAQIGKTLQSLNRSRIKDKRLKILFHTDACQAAGALNLDVQKLGVDLLTLNGSKIYGPKQTGLLYVRSKTKLEPLIYGGGQERGLRSGTENVPGMVGLAKALELVSKNRHKENSRLIGLRNYLWAKLKLKLPEIILNGPELNLKHSNELRRLPNNFNFQIPGVEGEALMFYLDSYNIAVGTGSACSSGHEGASHVLRAIGLKPKAADSSIRLTLGKHITKKDLSYVVKVMSALTGELKGIGAF